MRSFNKALQAMPATVALFMVLNPRWSTLPLAVWFLLAVAYEAARLFNAPPAADRVVLPRAFRWFAGGSVLMYFLMAVGLSWTENMAAGWFALEVKFSLLLIPLLMLHHWHRQGAKGLNAVPMALVAGLLMFMGWRLVLASVSGDAELWRYDGLAGPFHPTYMGMYLVLMPLLLREKSKWYNLALVVTGVFVGLLASKAAWIVAGLVWGCLLVMHGKRRGFRAWGIGMALVGMCLGGWLGDGGRLNEFTGYVSAELVSTQVDSPGRAADSPQSNQPTVKVGSSAGRMQAWNASLEVLEAAPFGVGTGDVTDALCEVYAESNSQYALEKRMNPHSTWLQLAVSHGWIGLLLILLWWFGTVVWAFRVQNALLLTWSIAWVLNGTIESLLELQQGVVPTILLCCVFALSSSRALEAKAN
ncbi:MAG: O-antigen ligase domain-containing protein [Crocinitomicaceae bacterium TMED209]|nr:MAG: O-antigen ligase domain-containing protein [Crocinitomicaceae bacterium TMED209]